MTRKHFLIAIWSLRRSSSMREWIILLCVLGVLCVPCAYRTAIAASMFAQTEPTDPITGHWGARGQTLLELKFDGKKTVSGTTIWTNGREAERRVPIDAGTFDLKSGALKIEGDGTGPDNAPAHFVIEGKLEKETLTGTYRFGGARGDFSFTKIAAQPKK